MTHSQSIASNKASARKLIISLMLFLCVLLSVLFAENIADSVRVGMALCASSIIPAVFPFTYPSLYFGAFICLVKRDKLMAAITAIPMIIKVIIFFICSTSLVMKFYSNTKAKKSIILILV